MSSRYWLVVIVLLVVTAAAAQNRRNNIEKDYLDSRWASVATRMPSEWYASEEARRVAENVLLSQKEIGGWEKNQPYHHHFSDSLKAYYLQTKTEKGATFDNGSTITELRFLAKVYAQLKDERYKRAIERGLHYIFISQYENGGWPQFYPVRDAVDETVTDKTVPYSMHITYNDDAMVNVMTFLKEIFTGNEEFVALRLDEASKEKAKIAFDKGVECILKTQIVVDNQSTVWCAQHHFETLAPVNARSYELASFSGAESAGIALLLMEIDNPSEGVIAAVEGAVKWFENNKIEGIREEWIINENGERDRKMIQDKNAPPIWGRFYDLDTRKPFFCSRDGIKRNSVAEISQERRVGYSWYSYRPAEVLAKYPEWQKKWIHVQYNAIVLPAQSIQKAIEGAPEVPKNPYVILVKNGIYNEKVIIDKPNIVLVGENRDSTRIIHAELSGKLTIEEYKGNRVGNGVIVLMEGADDCIISGITVYNNYGSTVEPTTAHQMSIFGRATRTIVINCNVWADGNDALALWAPDGDGMYYHADLDLRCPGVDFLCPRGWCYATRCTFYGDGRALIWHDGRGDYSKKLVITDSHFDSESPVTLGRYHHDAQFFLLNCTMSDKIIDHPIGYAYSDKVLDLCPWGQRVYMYNVKREGGNFDWMENNLEKSKDSPKPEEITALWTFGNVWDPEAKIESLWEILAY
ncbi:MAG: pectate lyase [Proteiniphilum sp.]|jgi:PelA/Pel-15E family pectate lyase|uniref:pectate lyase n=1 Tax=Proteiniphilum sp. TaxID=1926877 RepID=UPI002B20FAB8|nr:pectate lyase [Proteiniphilum sp.]MEA5128481.1 pectate lyase [Proteiniphilum sp.]